MAPILDQSTNLKITPPYGLLLEKDQGSIGIGTRTSWQLHKAVWRLYYVHLAASSGFGPGPASSKKKKKKKGINSV